MNNNRIYIGPPGSGKTYAAKEAVMKIIWAQMSDEEKETVEARYYNPRNFCEKTFNYAVEHYSPGITVLSVHDGMTVSDFIDGIEIVKENSTISFQSKPKAVLQLLGKMKMEPQKPAFIILDDVHRLNIMGALGELLYAFTHRGEKITTSSGRTIVVPEQLYVFMTYNNLKPDYSLDVELLNGFKLYSTISSKDKLKKAIVDDYLKLAYFHIDEKHIRELLKERESFSLALNKVSEEDQACEPMLSICNFIGGMPNFFECLDYNTAKSFISMKHLCKWVDVSIRNKTGINMSGKKVYNVLGKIYSQYMQYCSKESLDALIKFCDIVCEKYDYYNDFLKHISPEYFEEKEKYVIGYTNFLSRYGASIFNAEELLANKIRAQVLPLLRQYRNEGVIVLDSIPDIDTTATYYTRDASVLGWDKISISYNQPYRNQLLDAFRNRDYRLLEEYTEHGGIGYNSNYGVLIEIISDIINNPLINNWEIMNILLYDKELYCKLDISESWSSGLLCDSALVHLVPLGKSDIFSGNSSNSVYRSDLHSIEYKGKSYYLVTKIGTKNEEVTTNIKIVDCINKKFVNREIPLYKLVKVLVYKYLDKYRENLKMYKAWNATSNEIKELECEIEMVSKDIENLDSMLYTGISNKPELKESWRGFELRNTMLENIRNLKTWRYMTDRKIKGVYKIMTNRYQEIMDSTGIHQMILQGPPGTSKTYGAKKFLAVMAGLDTDNNSDWAKELSERQLITEDNEYKLPEGVKEVDLVYWDIIQFHPSYTYEDFVRGISVSTKKGNLIETVGEICENQMPKYYIKLSQPVSVAYETVNRTLGKMAKIAKANSSKKFYLIIDEINRANLATVFGELIYALEYRDSDVTTPYAVGDETKLQIPSNLYIIGTMNTADKSISSIDYAIRRRFLFFPVLPDISAVVNSIKLDDRKSAIEIRLFYIIERLFDIYMNTEDYNRSDVQIGHTYFIRKHEADNAEKDMENRFLFQVLPVLREYFNDGILTSDYYGANEANAFEANAFEILWKMILSKFDYDELGEAYASFIEEISKDDYAIAIQSKWGSKVSIE